MKNQNAIRKHSVTKFSESVSIVEPSINYPSGHEIQIFRAKVSGKLWEWTIRGKSNFKTAEIAKIMMSDLGNIRGFHGGFKTCLGTSGKTAFSWFFVQVSFYGDNGEPMFCVELDKNIGEKLD